MKLKLKVVIQHYAVVVTVAVSHVVLLCGFSRTERISVSSAAEARRLPVHDHTAFRLVPRPRPEPHVQGSPSHTETLPYIYEQNGLLCNSKFTISLARRKPTKNKHTI